MSTRNTPAGRPHHARPFDPVDRRLLRWYRDGVDPQTRLYRLSTFMGHVDPASTAIYLTITPQLLAEANHRFETFAQPAWSAGTP
jgi:hypothetical protein